MSKSNVSEYEKQLSEAFLMDLPVTRKEVARALRVSPDTITNWTKIGMPCLYLGRVQNCQHGARPRYIIRKCLKWLENRLVS